MGNSISVAQLRQMAQFLQKKKEAGGEAEALEKMAESGLNEEQKEKISSILQDKSKLQEILKSPQAQELAKKFGILHKTET